MRTNSFAAMVCRVSVAALMVAVATLAMSCRNDASPRAAGEPTQAVSDATQKSERGQESEGDQKGQAKYYYSPFVLKLEGGRFDTVSFKDVGLDRESPDPNDPLLEVISESLAYQLAERDALDYQAQVVYDEKILDPSNHLSCGINHLYVDVWRSSSPERWGYSLWSGCSELDNFAWKEVPNAAPDADLTQHVEPLTSSIVDSLVEAAQSNCFQKSC